MIDIHCHLLYGVDDGAKTAAESVAMLSVAMQQNITEIILTPHYRRGMFPYNKDVIISHFEALADAAKERGIRLYTGCEYHADTDMISNIQSGYCDTLAGSYYVLTEFSHNTAYMQMHNRLEELVSNGFFPVIAHAERYEVIAKEPEVLYEFREMGAMVQINANSILGIDGSPMKKICKRILKMSLADIVASDSHNTTDRRNNMLDAYKYVEKKYGTSYAGRLFEVNPAKITEEARSDI